MSHLDGRFEQTNRAAAPALGLRLGLKIQQGAVLQDEISFLPAVQKVGPFVQVPLEFDSRAVLRVVVVLIDLGYRTLRHRHRVVVGSRPARSLFRPLRRVHGE